MSIFGKIKDEAGKAGQRALGIDELRFKLDVTLEKLNRLDWIEGELTRSNDQIQNLKSFLTWYTNRVEPWFWSGNFSHADPEEELAGFLFNFLPGRVLLHLGPTTSGFAKATAEIGYEVHRVSPDSIASQAAPKSLPSTVDFLNVAGENVNLATLTALDSIHPAVIQTEFTDDGFETTDGPTRQPERVPASELIKNLRYRDYFWSVIIFRTEAEGLIRMGINLATVPQQAWGRIVFFRDQQLFLKAFHWCKTTLPRFRATARF